MCHNIDTNYGGSMLSQELLKELFTLNEHGQLIRNFRCGKAPKGSHSICEDKDGYLTIGINKKLYRTHRVVWMYVHGSFPDGDLDHINRNKKDNRIENLRVVTKSQNRQNITAHKNNKSGMKGVWLHKQTKRWCSTIGLNSKNKYLGSFSTKEEAQAAYMAASKVLHTMNLQ